jgi:hypothetical protein
MTPEQRQTAGAQLGLDPKDHAKITRTPALALPETEICALYMQWFIEKSETTPMRPYGISLQNKEDWVREYGQEALTGLFQSFKNKGMPSLHWVFIYTLEED